MFHSFHALFWSHRCIKSWAYNGFWKWIHGIIDCGDGLNQSHDFLSNQVTVGAFNLRSPASIHDRCLDFQSLGYLASMLWSSFPSKGISRRTDAIRLFMINKNEKSCNWAATEPKFLGNRIMFFLVAIITSILDLGTLFPTPSWVLSSSLMPSASTWKGPVWCLLQTTNSV